MERDDKENRIAVTALYKEGLEPNTIFKIHTLAVEWLCSYAIIRYNEKKENENRPKERE